MAARIVGTTVTGSQGAAAHASPKSCSLRVVFPLELRRSFSLRAEETILGRDPGSDGLLLDHGTISRQHAALQWSGTHHAHTLRDLGSRNGSQADGVSAAHAPRPLCNGSLVRLGDTLLVYEQDAAVPDAPQVSGDAVPGAAPGIRRLRQAMVRAAADPAPALIIGETGTGKEWVAREIHRLSGRRGKLVALNCAALTGQLVESQLFGHLKGAFTGATDAQPGLFRAAHGGTLFLDEIGDLPLELQPKLLRALQEGEVLPVGATQPVPVDVRVIAATHRDLARATRDQQFREDLYARLSLWELAVPPLRERRVDLLDWVDRLHREWAARRQSAGSLRFDADAAEALLSFAWPTNLRGLERLVHELGAAENNHVKTRSALPAWLAAAPSSPALSPEAEAGAEAVPTREAFTRAFEELDGSVHGLARRFGRDRRQIYRWLEAHGLADRRPRARPKEH
jgi:transcriptional regulator with GAF, ATPase, and Fis domain